MKMSTRGRYALIIMINLAKNEEGYLSIKEISEKENISIKYLEKIISLLSKAGLVCVGHGKNGGYKLVKKPNEYKIGEILRVTEGPMEPAPCINDSNCDKKDTCEVYSFWNGLYENINSYVDDKTLADFL
ncbi:MAG: Rrf2 family transcriptional regulator [Bacilli bacterium]|nr:Rrf2 family transcriptional regulator [Bacilli bacterium]